MASQTNSDAEYLPDGSFDWSGGADSSKVTTIQSTLNPNGLGRQELAWMFNCTVRGGGILQRTGFQPLVKVLNSGRWQGGFIYEPDSANPYLICSIYGRIYRVLLETPYTITDLSAAFGLFNPANAEEAFFCQGENYLVIQAGDYFTNPTPTLPLFWDGTTLRRSIGITNPTPSMQPGQNELPAATCMWYHSGRIWYGQARQVSAGDMVGGPSGTLANHFRDSILNVTENPLCFGGDGFTIPTNSGNIRALREENNLNESVANSRLLIWTRKSVFALSVPVTRLDWINANSSNQPLLVPVQRVNGTTSDRSVVAVNGDWFYQSPEPGIRSLITAVRQYNQWGNTPISQNEQRAMQVNDRGLMKYSGGIVFDNRMLQLLLPTLSSDGVNVIHQAILPLDFDVVSNLNTGDQASSMQPPVWEGAWGGLQFLQLFEGDFGGLHRAFGVIISDVDGSLNVWELTTSNRRDGA
jgi:hypothetical protein